MLAQRLQSQRAIALGGGQQINYAKAQPRFSSQAFTAKFPTGSTRSRVNLVTKAFGPGAAMKKPRPGEKKGFVEEMRFVAMRLHTMDQAPKEGGQPAAPQPFQQWKPTTEGYLKFLVESKTLYQTLEDIVMESSHAEYARFQNTGLERTQGLTRDIAFLESTYNLVAPKPEADGPGLAYSTMLTDLSINDPPAFMCHFYNIYFAHSAGGRMIGKKISSMCLEDAELDFYKWDGELSDLLGKVKDSLNVVADTWTDEEKAHCLDETTVSFQYSGALLRAIAT